MKSSEEGEVGGFGVPDFGGAVVGDEEMWQKGFEVVGCRLHALEDK